MKRVFCVVFLLSMAFLATACSKSKPIDVVNGATPVSTAYASIRDVTAAMATMAPEERQAYVNRNWPNLEEGVVYWLRRHDKIGADDRIERVEFKYGSAEDVTAETGDGGTKAGFFKDQLVAVVHVTGREKPLNVIVQCLNGTSFSSPDDLGKLQSLGSYTPIEQFTIGAGEGLNHHVDFSASIDLAERFNLPLYKGRKQTESNKISPDIAREMERTINRVQVTVHVIEGDSFDLRTGTFTPSPRRGR